MDFFSALGFQFNKQFTDDKAACMVVSDVGYVMLLQQAFYRSFTRRELCDTTRENEGLVALSCQSRAEVDGLVRRLGQVGDEPLAAATAQAHRQPS